MSEATVHAAVSRSWNGLWQDLFDQNPKATADQILRFLDVLKGELGW